MRVLFKSKLHKSNMIYLLDQGLTMSALLPNTGQEIAACPSARQFLWISTFFGPSPFFEYEMCSFPPGLFDFSLLPRKANKPVLADAIWANTKENQTGNPSEDTFFVLFVHHTSHNLYCNSNLL